MDSIKIFFMEKPLPTQDREKALQHYGLCVVKTIESIASGLAGFGVKLTDDEIDIRLIQMLAAHELIEERLTIPEPARKDQKLWKSFEAKKIKLFNHVGPFAARLDQTAVSNFISEIKNGRSEVAEILRQSKIIYLSGTLDDAGHYLRYGYQAGLICADEVSGELAIVGLHMFHLGINENGEYCDQSDDNNTRTYIENRLKDGRMAKNILTLRKYTRGWNMVMIKAV